MPSQGFARFNRTRAGVKKRRPMRGVFDSTGPCYRGLGASTERLASLLHAPSTMLRMVPFPHCAGEDEALTASLKHRR